MITSIGLTTNFVLEINSGSISIQSDCRGNQEVEVVEIQKFKIMAQVNDNILDKITFIHMDVFNAKCGELVLVMPMQTHLIK